MSKYGKAISVHEFLKSHSESPASSVVTHVGYGAWVASCVAGVLLIKNVSAYTCVEDVLADLASVGIRRIAIEWDGFGPSDRAKVER